MARVFDCFVFATELDLLEIRLHELAPVVDFFVLAEAEVTFKGEPKPLVFHRNRDRFAPFAERIRHVVVRDMPAGTTKADNWRRQQYQRNALVAGIDDARPDDIVLLSVSTKSPGRPRYAPLPQVSTVSPTFTASSSACTGTS